MIPGVLSQHFNDYAGFSGWVLSQSFLIIFSCNTGVFYGRQNSPAAQTGFRCKYGRIQEFSGFSRKGFRTYQVGKGGFETCRKTITQRGSGK